MLPTEKRTQLDGILQKMTTNGESEDAINFVVNDFKNKYSVAEQPKSFVDKTRGVLDMIFGGGKVGEAFGTQDVKNDVLGGKIGKEADYANLTPESISRLKAKGVPTTAEGQRQETVNQIEAPSAGEVLGSGLQSAALFIPGGAGAKGITTLATKAGVRTGASALGKIGAGILAGSAFDVASNLQQGKTGSEVLTPGLGALIGGAIPAAGVAKNVVVRFGDRQAPRIINSLIKPLAKDFSYGKNPGRAIVEEGIIANNFDDLLNGIRASRQKVGQEIGNIGEKLSDRPILNIRKALNPLDEAAKNAASQNNTALLSRINNVKRALTDVLEPALDNEGNMTIKSVGSRDLENLTFQQARHILSDVGDLTAFTGNPTDDKLVNSALKQVYGAIKEETLKTADGIDPIAAANFRKLTEKYADLTSAEVATKYRDKIVERQNLVGLSPRTIGIGTGLITALFTGGATLPAVLAGLTGATLDKLASTPAFKTRLAYLLSTKTQQEANYLFRKIPALSKFFDTKAGVLPGDVVLNKAKQLAKDVENIPNKQAGFISTGKSNSLIEEAKKYKSAEEFVKLPQTKIEQVDRLNSLLKINPKLEIYTKEGGRTFINRDIKSIKADYVEVPTTSKKSDSGLRTVKEIIFEFKDGTTDKFKNPVFSFSDNSKSQLEQIWKQSHSKSNSEAGKLLKSPLMVGAGATLAGALASTPSTVSFQKTPEQIANESKPVKQPVDFKKEISFRETGSVKKDPYTIVKKNTNGTYDLGKYQINTAALKAYGDDFLGKSTTSKELLASPHLQEKFIEGFIKKMESEGYNKDLIIALWHRGWGNRSKERLNKLLNEPLTKKYLNNRPK